MQFAQFSLATIMAFAAVVTSVAIPAPNAALASRDAAHALAKKDYCDDCAQVNLHIHIENPV